VTRPSQALLGGAIRAVGEEVSRARCGASITLTGPLRRSLAAECGGEVASMWRCELQRGHGGAHQIGVCPDRGERGWLRWDAWGFRLGRAGPWYPQRRDRPAPGRHRAADATHRAAAGMPVGADVAAGASRRPSSERRPQPEALWAIAASVQRLADVIGDAADRLTQVIAAANPPTGPAAGHGGRHAADRSDRAGPFP
jgi:hypothetical protein